MNPGALSYRLIHSLLAPLKSPGKRLLLLPLWLSVVMSGGLVKAIRRLHTPAPHELPGEPGSGLSVVIPERANPDQLRRCLESLEAAVAEVAEAVESIVVVSGSLPADYDELRRRFRQARWVFSPAPLDFAAAVRVGLDEARHPWVYLLNSDMVLDRQALQAVLPWRSRHVFAVASQIFFQDPHRRREETGWTDFRIGGNGIEIFDVEPEDPQMVRGTLYAGGGSSLFRRDILKEAMGKHDPYAPCYWEDVEWGVEAWKRGYQVLFCPQSRVWHAHRATVSRLYSPEEIDRIFKRNACQFQLRNLVYLCDMNSHYRAILELDRRSFLSLVRPSNLLRTFHHRLRGVFQPFDDSGLGYVRQQFHPTPAARLGDKPVVLFVTPFSVFPPAHGSAVRMHHLLCRLSRSFHIVLLSDEAAAYTEEGRPYFSTLASIHLVGGRDDAPRARRRNRIERMRSHAHKLLRDELRRLIAVHRPSLVQIEHVELAALIGNGKCGVPWLLTLHDVLLPEAGAPRNAEDRCELRWIRRYDTVITCSKEDAGAVPVPNVRVIPNGVSLPPAYCESPSSPVILFVGAFRYQANLEGLCDFLESVFPVVRQSVPGAELWVLGGAGAVDLAAPLSCFRQPAVVLYDYVETVDPFYRDCAVTINPVKAIRGSSIKLLESLAAGRVCVTTTAGARGYGGTDFPAMIRVGRIEAFVAPLIRLLTDHAYRREIERVPPERLAPLSWDAAADRLAAIYRQSLNGRVKTQPERKADDRAKLERV